MKAGQEYETAMNSNVVIRFLNKADYDVIQATGYLPIFQLDIHATTIAFLLQQEAAKPGFLTNPGAIGESLWIPAERAEYFVAFDRISLDENAEIRVDQDREIKWRFPGAYYGGQVNISDYIIDMGKTTEKISIDYLRRLQAQAK